MMDNLTYIEEVYRDWQKNPSGVDPVWDAHFRATTGPDGRRQSPGEAAPEADMAYRQSRVDSLLWAFRDIGYLYARLNPLGGDYGPDHDYLPRGDKGTYQKLTLEEFGISEADLDTVFSAGRAMKPSKAPLREILLP